MLRYLFIRKLYPLLSLFAQFYFFVVDAIFALVYATKPKKSVEWSGQEAANELLFLSAKSAAEKIRRKEISSSQLVAVYIERIRQVQPTVNAIVAENFEQAVAEAKAVDEYLAALDENSDEFHKLPANKPLLGIPFTFKNNMDVKGFVSVCGHKKFLGNAPAQRDSLVMERLRRAGGIPVAITNLPKLAMNWCTENEVYGRTCNPYDVRRIPGGSSGGESAIVASGASIFGIGNDLGGSVRIPAFMCGLFGLKPTKGVIPLEGFVPELDSEISRSQWSIGPLCRYAEDLPLVFATLAGKPVAEVSAAPDFSETNFIYMEDLHIWFVEKLHPEMRQAVRKSVQHFENAFNTTVQKVDFPLAHHFYELWGAFGFGSPSQSLSSQLAELPKLVQGTSDLTCCAWFFGLLHSFVETRNDQERDFMVHKLTKLRAQIETALGTNGILLLPPWPTVAPFHRQNVFTPFNLAYTQLFNVLGFPALVCPVGLDEAKRVPLAVQLVGPLNSEPLLMAAARELEAAFGGWIRQ